MSLEIIKVIREAEDKSESIKKEAIQQSKQIITDANAKAAGILSEAEKEAELNAKDVLTKAESEGQILYDKIVGEAAKDCDAVLEKADKKMKAATSIILERIVKTSGNS